MFVFEIVTPGTWLDYEDRDWSWRVQKLLLFLELHFFEANTALNWFLGAQSIYASFSELSVPRADSSPPVDTHHPGDQARGGTISLEDLLEAEVRFKRERWAGGGVPREFENCLPIIYARAFLYALDMFEKFLGVLAREANVPEQVAAFYAQVAKEFPHLRGVRNTIQHLEDRSRGLGAGRNPQPLDLKPFTNGMFKAPGGGFLMLSCLNGSRFGSTMADGHYGEVDVSPESMERLRKILQGVLLSFKWHGPEQHKPSA